MGENDTYQVLKQMADNMVQINKSITPSEWEEAQERVKNLAKEGRRIDGAPATASIYGVIPRKATATAVETGGMSEAEKAKARKALMAEIERMKSNEAGRDAEAVDRGEPEGDAGKAHPQAGTDGVCKEAAGRDCQRGNADRGGSAQAGGSGSEGESGGETGAQLKEEKRVRRRRLTDETVRQLWQRHKAGERTENLAAEVGCSIYTLNCRWRAMYGAQKRRRKDGPTDEERARIQQEYAAGKTYKELKAEHAVGSSTLVNILKHDTRGDQAAEQRIAELEAQIADYKDRLRRAAALLRGLDIIGRWMEDGLDDAGCDPGGRAPDV